MHPESDAALIQSAALVRFVETFEDMGLIFRRDPFTLVEYGNQDLTEHPGMDFLILFIGCPDPDPDLLCVSVLMSLAILLSFR